MFKKLIKYLTPKKSETMAKQGENKPNVELEKEVKKLVKALQHSNDNLKAMQSQFGFPEEHYINQNIKSNEKILNTYTDGK